MSRHFVFVVADVSRQRTTSVGTVIVSKVTLAPSPICLHEVAVKRHARQSWLRKTYPNSFAPQPSTLPSRVLTKLLLPPVATRSTTTPRSAGTSNSLSDQRMFVSSKPAAAASLPMKASTFRGEERVGRMAGLDFAYGSAMDFGVNSRGTRGCWCGRWTCPKSLAAGTSHFRNPSCPCEFAFSVMACANVRPSDVRART